MELLFIIIGAALVAWLNHYLATERGRNAIGWAVAGAIFGLLSTILLLILGKTEEKQIELAARFASAINSKE
jgi:hypothetical protein